MLHVVICWKIRIFAYWTTPLGSYSFIRLMLWFAEKFVSLLIEQHPRGITVNWEERCDLLKNSYLCLLNNTSKIGTYLTSVLWFAEKFVSLLIEQHPGAEEEFATLSCDLLKNSYLCLLNNTEESRDTWLTTVVICWKIRIFAYWTTPTSELSRKNSWLWFAEKFVSLLIEQHLFNEACNTISRCDLLKNSYLCLLNNTLSFGTDRTSLVVICWKIRIFAYWTTPPFHAGGRGECCDLLKNSYLCLLNNTVLRQQHRDAVVVICWKIRIFAYWTTPAGAGRNARIQLWFAEKFVSLLIEQHPRIGITSDLSCCDLLKNSYLCLLNNTANVADNVTPKLWFAEKFVSLLIEQHHQRITIWRHSCCDLLKNSYLCLLNNTRGCMRPRARSVVICWKIRIFAYWTTPAPEDGAQPGQLWFAEKFVSLLIEQHHGLGHALHGLVVICWKIRIFAYWTTPSTPVARTPPWLWFAEKFVSLLIEQHPRQ